MLSFALAAAVQVSLIAADAKPDDSYAKAYQAIAKDGTPMLVMVGTEWCAPCQRMKRSVLPKLRTLPIFRRVAFAMVDPDESPQLAKQITGGGPVPQLVMFRKNGQGWLRRKLVGGQELKTVEKFVAQAVADHEAEKAVTKGKPRASQDAKRKPSAKSQAAGTSTDADRPKEKASARVKAKAVSRTSEPQRDADAR